MSFYFDRFEGRRPPEPLPHAPAVELMFQFLAVVTVVLGAWYIAYRWTATLNHDALLFSLALVVAETMGYLSLLLYIVNLWQTRDTPRRTPPASIWDCVAEPGDMPDRPVVVDVFFATYNEDPELVRLGIRDAKAIRYPHALDLRIHVLDDGRREAMRHIAEAEGVLYLSRPSNIGYKAGNLRNAMEQTSGDFILICDADTRPFPQILEETLGYFRDPDVAWVQTPQWFFDIPLGRRLPESWERRFGRAGRGAGRLVERALGPVTVGDDPFCNDPRMFYDIIQRRRNWANAAFCCGAASIHRREAVMQAAIRVYAEAVEQAAARRRSALRREGERQLDPGMEALLRRQAALEQELTPYVFHVSEDIYTSLVMHSDPDRRWKSVYHPRVLSKMLSPQDLLAWTIQRFKWTGGSLDILVHDRRLFRRGLSWPQRLMYANSLTAGLSALWNLVFLLTPPIYLLSGVAPVSAYSLTFFQHLLPFMVVNNLMLMVATWGMPTFRGTAMAVAIFPVGLRALWTVLRRRKISFPVTPKTRQEGPFPNLVWPQIAILALTLGAFLVAALRLALGDPGFTLAGLIANGFWGLYHVALLTGVIRAAYWKPDPEPGAGAPA
jgi:cellulose synthase (UDP-forming)